MGNTQQEVKEQMQFSRKERPGWWEDLELGQMKNEWKESRKFSLKTEKMGQKILEKMDCTHSGGGGLQGLVMEALVGEIFTKYLYLNLHSNYVKY